MKKITFLFLAMFAFCWQSNAQSTINITTSGGNYATEKWVSITDAVDGGGNQVWAQGDGTYGNGAGLINEDISLAPGTYYVNCYDKYSDGWDGTLISVTAYGNVIGDNGGTSPSDSSTNDATSSWETPADELEASFMIVVPNPPACSPPTGMTQNAVSTTESNIAWTAGGSETDWTYEYGVSPYTQGGGGTSGTVATTPTLSLTGLVAGETYDIFIQSNCGSGNGDSIYSTIAWTQPITGESCGFPFGATVEADCSTATPITIDFSTAPNIGGVGTCDSSGDNRGYWYEFTAPASGAVKISNSGSDNEYVVLDTCNGTELVCGSMPASAELSGLNAAAVYKIAIWKDSFQTLTTDTFCIEEVSCGSPSALAATSITATSVALGWTNGGSEALWDIELVDITASGTVTGNPTTSGITNPYTLSGLTAANDYEVYVRADCTGGDVSDWFGPVAFTTACTEFTPDYTADMSVNVPNCWVEANNGDATSGPTDIGSGNWYSSNHNGTPSNVINLYSDVRSDWIISPIFDLSSAAPSELNVYVALTNNGTNGTGEQMGSDDEVKLLMTIDGGTTWTTMQTWAQGTEPSETGLEITYDLTAVTGTVQFAFLGDEGTVNDTEDVYFHVSKFQVRETPSCSEPSSLAATNITDASADLAWTSGGAETLWDIELVDITAGNTATGAATATGVTNPYTLTGLTAQNDYCYYVRADCTGGDVSPWAGPFCFSTPCAAVSAAYTNDMSANAPDACWNEAGSGEVAAGPSGLGASSWKAGRAFTDADGNVVNSNVMNLYQSNTAREWLISPVFDLDAIGASGLLVKVAVTDYTFSGTSAATATDTMGSDDEVQLVMTTDNGTTWTNVTTWNVGNQPDVTGTDYILDLSGMTGSVQFAFFASDGTVDDSEDYDFHVGTFEVSNAVLSTVSFDNEAAFTYYPNPVKNTLTLNAQNTIDNVTMYNMLGQVVLNAKPNNVDSELDMSNLKSGAYFVKVTIANNTKTIKVIKQ